MLRSRTHGARLARLSCSPPGALRLPGWKPLLTPGRKGDGHRFFTEGEKPEHWAADVDREPSRDSPESNESLKKWVRAVLTTAVTRRPEEQEVRKFWEENTKRRQSQVNAVSGSHWSLASVLQSSIARPVPVKATLWHLSYSSAITGCFMHLKSHFGFFSHEDLGLEQASMLSRSQVWIEASEIVQYMVENHGLLQNCCTFLATALFMTLSFRLNRATMRWWTGRQLCGDLLQNVRCLNQTAHLSISNKAVALELGLLSYAFARATEFHVRQEPDARYREAFRALLPPHELEALLAAPHRPYFFAERLTLRLSDAYDAGHAKNVRLVVAVEAAIDKLVATMEGLERIKSTPEPWSYQKHMRLLVQLWLGLLPMALVPTLQLATPVLGSSIGYVVYKLDDVAVEISSPFGFDKSDVSLCLLNDRLQRELLASSLTFIDWQPISTVVLPDVEHLLA